MPFLGVKKHLRPGRKISFIKSARGDYFKSKALDTRCAIWSIPKGLYADEESPSVAARREFEEETGCSPPIEIVEIGEFRQPSGKIISAWAGSGDFDLSRFKSNLFSMEWPPKSGQMVEFPEADRAAWFNPSDAVRKITKGQSVIIRALLEKLGVDLETSTPAKIDTDRQGSLF